MLQPLVSSPHAQESQVHSFDGFEVSTVEALIVTTEELFHAEYPLYVLEIDEAVLGEKVELNEG